MTRQFIAAVLIGSCGIGAVIYGSYRTSNTVSEEIGKSARQDVRPGSDSGVTSPDRSSQEPRPPTPARPAPPPAFPGVPEAHATPPEPERSLIGANREYLAWIEGFLPAGAQVYTYPVSASQLAAAVVNADLDGGGVPETVVVYTGREPTREEGSLPLTLAVLASNGAGKTLSLRASVSLTGQVFFNPRIDGVGAPLAIQSVTGKSRPEIIVLSGAGASAGGALQVFSYNGSVLAEVARIGGHFFRVRRTSPGKPAVITGRWKDDDHSRVYVLRGDRFEETAHVRR